MVITKTLQPALLALEDSTKVESPAQPSGNGLGSDPLADEAQQQRRRDMALTVCRGASTAAAWLIADRLAQSWGMSCQSLGCARPADDEGDFRRQRVGVKRG